MVAEIDKTKELVKLVIIRKGPVIFTTEYIKTTKAIKDSTTYTQ